ncbi:uncharacterized protein LOC141530880 [Cotesia typhae]|uniref:uncharacterized protein LOC141530880 n=1 Tax=Cotesia typhae TaxID=2053667 RepID=UPI003D68DEA5
MNEEEINDIVYEANRNIIQLKKLLELTQKFRVEAVELEVKILQMYKSTTVKELQELKSRVQHKSSKKKLEKNDLELQQS